MELIENLASGFVFLAGWQPLLIIALGAAAGIVIGAMPGLSPSMGVALLVPFTYAMDPALAIVLLVSLYQAADYGGAITAVTINAPGTPSSAVTAIDGFPLTQQGQAGTALGVSLVASTVGGMFGTLVLVFFSLPLAKVALSFHPADYFGLAVFGLVCTISLGTSNWAKALAAALLGLLINTVGIDPISGATRFTAGITLLYDGFSLIPTLIGLFAVSEILMQIEQHQIESAEINRTAERWPRLVDYWNLRGVIVRSSLIGTLIGIFPGAGATVASFVAYDFARRFSRTPQRFGKGSTEGVAAAEAANSSSVGGALVPMLTLGIPGSASTAVLIGALMIHDVVPGPQMFQKNPQIIYALFASLFLANFFSLGLGAFGCHVWLKVTSVSKRILYPLILAISVVGSFAVRYSLFDVASCLGFGILGWFFRRHDYPVVPIVLGMVLGSIAETNFRQAAMMGGYWEFFRQPVCVGLLIVSAVFLIRPLWKSWTRVD